MEPGNLKIQTGNKKRQEGFAKLQALRSPRSAAKQDAAVSKTENAATESSATVGTREPASSWIDWLRNVTGGRLFRKTPDVSDALLLTCVMGLAFLGTVFVRRRYALSG